MTVATTLLTAQVATRGVGAALARWGDPRRRLLRQRRLARQATMALGSVTAASTAATAGLVVLDAPSLLVAMGCGATVLVATPTTGAAVRLRRLYKRELPPERTALPSRRSAARGPLSRLATAEASLRHIVAALDTHVAVPSDEVRQVHDAATAAALRLRHEASALVVMERAGERAPATAAELRGAVYHAAVRLDRGVVEYERVVAAAAHALAVTTQAHAAGALTLQDTVDRVDGLTQALAELAGPARY